MYVTAAGMVCSVGLTAPASCAAMRAGIAKFDELGYHDNHGQPIIGANVPDLPVELSGGERLVELLAEAVSECLAQRRGWSLENVPLLVGLSESSRPGRAVALETGVISAVERRLAIHFNRALSRPVPMGHTSAFRSLWLAREALRQRLVPACVVCAVDQYNNARSLEWLDSHSRLKTEDNSDGVIPGEAAGAVLVELEPADASRIATKVRGLGFGHETAHVLNEEPLLGLGLAEAARGALAEAGLEMHEIDFRVSDVTGESYGFREQSLALARLLRSRRDEFPLWHCADSVGDTGATAGICQLVIAFHAFHKGYAPGDRAMCYASAVFGDRAVAVLERQTASRNAG